MNHVLAQHPASVDAYIRHGWNLVPIPPGRKGPVTHRWNDRANMLKSQGDLPSGWGIGLAHAYSGTCAIDIDDFANASFAANLQGLDLTSLFNSLDAVGISSGRQNHGKLLYAMPFGLVLPSKKLSVDGKNYLDFRCGTADGLTVQDVLPPSVHPDTGQSYQWTGKGHFTRLPLIPPALLGWWQRLIDADKQTEIRSPNKFPTNWIEIREALEYISADCDRKQWIDIGAALHYTGHQIDQLETAYQVWDEWSQCSEKYPGPREMHTQWRSFRAEKGKVVRIGTIFHLAAQRGWQRKLPDITKYFEALDDPSHPKNVMRDLRPAPPELPLDLIPDILRQRAEEIAVSIGCDPCIPFAAGIAAVCGAADAQSRLRLMPGFEVPPILWLATIGNPADKKTPGSAPMLNVLADIEAEAYPDFKRKLLEWEAQEAMFAMTKKSYLEYAASTDALLAGMEHAPKVHDLPAQPQPLRIIVSDITSQKLVRTCADRPRGVLCYLDEMNGWTRKISDKNGGEDRSTWVRSFEGKRYEMDRVGVGSIVAENLAVSIYGNLQPLVLKRELEGLATDGLIQRFIPVIPNTRLTKRGNPMPENQTSKAQWENSIRLIYSLPTITYELSEEGYHFFRAFQGWYEGQKQAEYVSQTSDVYMTAFGKLEGIAGRLMMVWHLLEEPFSNKVSASVVKRVCQFVRFYLIPSLRYAFQEVANRDLFDGWFIDWIIQRSDMPKVSMTDIRSHAAGVTKGMSYWAVSGTILASTTRLEAAGWLMRLDDGSQEAKGFAEWVINPRLKDMYEKYRDEVIKAKQRLIDVRYSDWRSTNADNRKLEAYGYDADKHESELWNHDGDRAQRDANRIHGTRWFGYTSPSKDDSGDY